MKDRVVVDRNVKQYKGNFHMHTNRSWDSVFPYGEALREYREKGYDFCVVTDHEVYWDSTECDSGDFIALSGVESAFILPEERPYWILDKEYFRSLHINLVNDETQGRPGFLHDQVLRRPIDYGISSWNRYIEYCRQKNQLVIVNHPDWSRLDPEIFLAIEGCFAFEIINTGDINGGGNTDEALWDYALSRGKRILALSGDDTHKYGPENHECGGSFTMLSASEFSRAGLVRAIKEGTFYPSTGPRIYDMRITDDILHMEFDDAVYVRIVGRDFMGKGFLPQEGKKLNTLDWDINSTKKPLKYFRVEIIDERGRKAWSQPVFLNDWDESGVALRDDPHTPIPEEQRKLNLQ